MAYDFDLFVIGGGSAGVRCGRIAAGHGARVAVAEEERIRWEMEAARMTVEVWRTQSANNRTIDRSAE